MALFCEEFDTSLSILINNAGILQIGLFESISNEQHARTINVNVLGVINLCQAAFPYLKQQPNAKVVNLCSASSDYGVPELTTYSASKHAVKAITESLEIEWSKYDIQVCDVLPPFISTNMLSSQKTTAKVMDRLGVDLKAEDVVKVIYKQIQSAKTHRTVGLFYGLLHRLNNVSPFFIRRLTMKFLSR
jgi:short-subunit dehydrogenase